MVFSWPSPCTALTLITSRIDSSKLALSVISGTVRRLSALPHTSPAISATYIKQENSPLSDAFNGFYIIVAYFLHKYENSHHRDNFKQSTVNNQQSTINNSI